MINELRSIAIFVEVAKQGSFRTASKKLNLSPSAVSYNVAELEKHIGNPLLYRSTRKLSLTHHGEVLYERAHKSLASVNECLHSLKGNDDLLEGRLSVSATTALMHSPLNRLTADFCNAHRNISLELNYSDEQTDLIRDGVDVVLRAGEMADSTLRSKRITQVRRILVCSKTYFHSQPKPQTPEDLLGWKWIRLAMMPSNRYLYQDRKKISVRGIDSQITVNTVEAMTQFCTLGMGLATPPADLVAPQLESGLLVEVLPEWQVESIPIYAVWPGNAVRNKLAHRFITLLENLDQVIDQA